MANATINLTLACMDSSVPNDQVWISVLGTDPSTGQFGYLDFTTGTMVTGSSFSYQSGVTSKTLAELLQLGPSLALPAIKSGRIYMVAYQDFDTFTATSGPTFGKVAGTVPQPYVVNGVDRMWDKIEFDTSTSGMYNLNPTCVDFYGISYTVEALDNTGTQRTVGLACKRSDIIDAYSNIPAPASADQKYGNIGLFKQMMVESAQNTGEILRIVATKASAWADWAGADKCNRVSHFLDEYIKNECFKPNRQFSFYDKNYPTQKNIRYGVVNAAGTQINLYTDANHTTPYTVPTLDLPATSWPNPDMTTPSNWQKVGSSNAEEVDWGFVMIGNVATSGAAQYWGSDPAAMAIMISICRGVMHLDDGTTSWVNDKNYYLGTSQSGQTPVSSSSFPIYYYASILHANATGGMAYALSYDDIYGNQSQVWVNDGADVTVNIHSLEKVTVAANLMAMSEEMA